MSTAPPTPVASTHSWASALACLDWYDEHRIRRWRDPKWRSAEMVRLRHYRMIVRIGEVALLTGIAGLFVVDKVMRMLGQLSLFSAGGIAEIFIVVVMILFFLGWLVSSSWNRRIAWLSCLGELDARVKALESSPHE